MSDGSLSDQTLDALGGAAALMAAAPLLRAGIRVGGTTLFEVAREAGAGPAAHAVLSPCAFHTAVARAHRARKAGERIAMVGAPAGAHPVVEWGVPAEGLALPGGMLRLRKGRDWWHVAPVAVPLAAVLAALRSSPGSAEGGEGAGDHGEVTLAVRPDNDLEVTLLHVTTGAGDEDASAGAVDALITAVGRVGVADLAARLGAGDPDKRSVTPFF